MVVFLKEDKTYTCAGVARRALAPCSALGKQRVGLAAVE
ncbi:hypothetical protein THTE_1235 [Thermogutta terrifontis]|uniref:Uncharacterized protein n=1 Tax=Thermogutta terrifontis TaxID=1331910 RepID=A0A286RD29_9BACT|nr:hypothetical protein THTE_1235 [Thermogutta terrifontis]